MDYRGGRYDKYNPRVRDYQRIFLPQYPQFMNVFLEIRFGFNWIPFRTCLTHPLSLLNTVWLWKTYVVLRTQAFSWSLRSFVLAHYNATQSSNIFLEVLRRLAWISVGTFQTHPLSSLNVIRSWSTRMILRTQTICRCFGVFVSSNYFTSEFCDPTYEISF